MQFHIPIACQALENAELLRRLDAALVRQMDDAPRLFLH